MTYKEKLKIEHPDMVGDDFIGGCKGCPYHYGYAPYRGTCTTSCWECWDQEIPETEKQTDSGDARLIDELMKENKDLRIELREVHDRLEEKDRYLTDNVKALLNMQEQLDKYECISETRRKQIESKANDYRMKFDALINQGFTEDQIMQLLPMWMDD